MTGPASLRADLIGTVADRLRQLIVTGQLAPGAALIEREVGRRLDVSRGTARAALRSLQHEGYVRSDSVERYARFSVAPLTMDDLADLSSIMAALDGTAARMAAEVEPKARAQLASRLTEINDHLSDSIGSRAGVKKAHELDRRFHEAYVTAAGPRLRGQWSATHAHLHRYAQLYSSALARRSVTEHRAIIAAIRAGKAPAAQAAAERNWLASVARAARGIRVAGERGVW
ncbi:MAG: GntR family transcriptional regulator [Gemmatimonadota bacterium]